MPLTFQSRFRRFVEQSAGRSLPTVWSPLFLFLSLSLFVAPAWSQIPSEKIFPDSTKGFFVIRNLKNLEDQWRQTQIGQLMSDPIMDAFKKDFSAQMSKRLEDRFGITLDQIRRLPSGEIAGGMIAIPGETPGYAFTLDVADRQKETEDYIQRLTQKLLDIGIKRTTEQYKGQEVVVFTFPEPTAAKKEEKKEEKKIEKESRPVSPATGERQAHYILKDRYLIISDRPHLVRLIFDRIQEPEKGQSLGDLSDFQTVMKRCRDDLPEGTAPLIAWYLEPLNYGESIRVLMKGPAVEKRRDKPSIFTILKEQGFDAIRGIGGVVNIKTENKEVIYRIFVHTKKPYRLAMRMLAFPDNAHFVPPGWMPPEIVRCSMVYVDPTAIFDNFGTLFDALVMQGEEGVWNDILKGLEEDPNGPQINLRKEIIDLLGQRVLGMSAYHLPITTTSEHIVIAVELKDGKEETMKKSLEKLFDNDTEMQQTKHQSYILWHRVPADDVILPDSDIIGVPDLGSTPKASASKKKEDEAEKEAEPMFPGATITVAKGCLFVGTDHEYLMTVLDRLDQKLPSIADHKEYKEVDKVFTDMGVTNKPHFFQFFARTDETLRPTYEMIRQMKMPQSQAILGRVINALFVPADGEDGAGVRQQAIDGTNLPEFDKIKHYFGPAGMYAATEEDGYFFKGFLLEKKTEEEIGPNRKIDATEPVESVTDDAEKKTKADEAKTDEKKTKTDEKTSDVEKSKSNPRKISGKVTVEGKPLEAGTICFESDTFSVRGTIGQDGSYVINSDKEGFPPGSYRVFILKARKEIGVDTDGKPIFDALIDEKFADPKTSSLLVEISGGMNHQVEFELSAPKKTVESEKKTKEVNVLRKPENKAEEKKSK